MKCIICGKGKAPKVKLPFGTFFVHGGECSDILTRKVVGSFPIVLTCLDDIGEHELLSQDKLECLTIKDDREVSMAIRDYIGNDDTLWQMYNEALEYGARIAEGIWLNKIPAKDLPLVGMNKLEYDETRALLEKRLKEGK
jgi:hypothetical protein